MFKYLYFNLCLSFKKYSTYILPFLFAISSVVLILMRTTSRDIPNSRIISLDFFYYLLIFVWNSIYISIKMLSIFKQTETNGIEILVLTLPIKRSYIFLAKLLCLLFHIIIFTIFVFITFLIIGAADSKSTSEQILTFASSIAIGTLIVSMIISCLYLVIVVTFNMSFTIIFAVLLPFTLSVSSPLMMGMGKGSISKKPYGIIALSKKHLDGKKVIDFDGDYQFDRTIANRITEIKSGWYKNIASFDVFQQFSRYYKITKTPNHYDKNTPGSWTKKRIVLQKDNLLNSNYISIDVIDIFPKERKLEKYVLNIAPLLESWFLNLRVSYKWILKNANYFADQIYKIILNNLEDFSINSWLKTRSVHWKFLYKNFYSLVEEKGSEALLMSYANFIKKEVLFDYKEFSLYPAFVVNQHFMKKFGYIVMFLLFNKVNDKDLTNILKQVEANKHNYYIEKSSNAKNKLKIIENPNPEITWNYNIEDGNPNRLLLLGLLPINNELLVYKYRPFVDYKKLDIFWIVLSFFLLFSSFFIYLFRDFK